LTVLVSLIGRSFLSEVERPSILRTGLPVAPSLSNPLATRLSAHAPREAGRSAATSCCGATYAFSLRPLSGASLSFVSPLDRRLSAHCGHSSEAAERRVSVE